MADETEIEWADSTFNPWEGCQKVGPGCDHCYAETRNARFGGGTAPNWGPGAPRRRTSASNWRKPLQWNREAEAFWKKHGRRRRVFCASLADVFDNAVDPQWRADLFALIDATRHLDWMLLTKRIGNVQPMLLEAGRVILPVHVWLGITVVNQEEAERDIPKLMQAAASIRFLSCEPLLGPIDLTALRRFPDRADDMEFIDALRGTTWIEKSGLPNPFLRALRPGAPLPLGHREIDQVIVGGESGPGARPMHPCWVRDLRDQCEEAGTAFLFKQWGEWQPVIPLRHADDPPAQMRRIGKAWMHGRVFQGGAIHHFSDDQPMVRVGKSVAGRLLEGIEHNGIPSWDREIEE